MRAALVTLLLCGCAARDLCADFPAEACISVEVRAGSSGVGEVDQLRLSVPELHLIDAATPTAPDRSSLPVATAIAAGSFTGAYSLTVRARDAGVQVAAASLSGEITTPGEHQHVVVLLQPPQALSPFTVVQGQPMGETLTAIWGAGADHVFAVGTNGLHLDRFSGSWHRKQTTTGRDYHAVWGSAADDVYAVGGVVSTGAGVIEHFDGTNWREEFLADAALYGVWSDGVVVYAVSADGMIYGKQVGGTAWQKRLSTPLLPSPFETDPSAPVLQGISGNGAADFVMPAGVDRFYHYEGSGNFINLDPAVDRSLSFRSVWSMPGPTTSTFLGTNYLGVCWLTATPPAPGATMLDDKLFRLIGDESQPGADQLFIRGIWGTGGRVVFVGDGGHMYTYEVGADAIVPLTSPTDSALYGAWGSAADDVWVVGERELLLHGSVAP